MNRFPQKNRLKRNRFRAVLLGSSFVGTLLLAPAESNAQWSGPFGFFGSRNPAPVPVGPPQYLSASPSPTSAPYLNGAFPPAAPLSGAASGPMPQFQGASQYQAAQGYQAAPGYQANYANPVNVQNIPSYQNLPNYQNPGLPSNQSLPSPGLYQQPINNSAPIQAGPRALGQPMSGIPQTQAAFLPTAGYSSQWNRAPVTYYRPVTQLDPTTGTTVTRMVPCTSYELQAQRVPMLTLHPTLGSSVAANRWPSMAAPSYGSTPVPSALSGTATSSVPNYGAAMIPSTGFIPAPVWGNPSLMPAAVTQGVVPANAWTQTPMNGTNSVMPSNGGQPIPGSFGSNGGFPNASGLSNNPPSTYSEAIQNGWTPVPGLSAPPSQNAVPGPFGTGSLSNPLSPNVPQRLDPPSVSPGLADEESTVKPSLDRSRENSSNNSNLTKPPTEQISKDSAKPLFQLRKVMREPMQEDRVSMPLPKLPAPSTPAFAPVVEPPASSSNPLNFDGPHPIQAPSDLPEPQFSPGLLDPRDRTASGTESIQRNNTKTPIQWISSPSQNEKRTRASTAAK